MFQGLHFISTLVLTHRVNSNSSSSFIAIELNLRKSTVIVKDSVKLVNIQALQWHESIVTTQIFTHAGQERLSKMVADI